MRNSKFAAFSALTMALLSSAIVSSRDFLSSVQPKPGKTRAGSRTVQEGGPRRNTSTTWFGCVPPGGGAREVARRRRQILRGMLRPSA